MKRIKILFAIITSALLVSCSEPSMESKARQRYQQHFRDIFEGRYSSVNIIGSKLMFSGDSICIYQYTAEVENFTGKKEEQRMEYVITWTTSDKPKLMEFTYPIGVGSNRALQDDLIRTNDIFKTGVSPKDSSYEKSLRIEAVLRHALDPAPFKRDVVE